MWSLEFLARSRLVLVSGEDVAYVIGAIAGIIFGLTIASVVFSLYILNDKTVYPWKNDEHKICVEIRDNKDGIQPGVYCIRSVP